MLRKHELTHFACKCRRSRNIQTSFKKSIFCIVILSIISSICYANKIDIYISGGSTFTKLSNENTVTINDFVMNEYRTNQRTHWNGLWSIGLVHSFEGIFNSPSDLSIGMAGYSINLSDVRGTEYPFANDGFYDTLNYKFNAQSNALMFESRLFYTSYSWQPFALIGIGNAWNHLGKYNEVPTDPSLSSASLPQVFNSHTENAFAYEFGIGIQRQFFEDPVHKIRYSASLDYRYFNFGKGQLGSFPAQTKADRLHVNNLNTQGIMFSLKVSV